jgi:CIC family chloride channel protein
LFRLSEKRLRTLVACGAGAGTAAAFNAPIAGSIFAVEIILDNISSVNFSAIVIASVIASTIARLIKGNTFFFDIPNYAASRPMELVLFAILGILAASSAWAFSRLRYFIEDISDKFSGPKYLLPAFGGIMVGIIGIFSYQLRTYPKNSKKG